MNRRLVIRPLARLDVAVAMGWYAEQAPGLDHEFLRIFESTVQRIEENPYQYQIVHRELHRVTLRKFPYNIIYAVNNDDEIIILRCIHGHSDPRRWQDERVS
jgi:plasmid stabilization system protein ParE